MSAAAPPPGSPSRRLAWTGLALGAVLLALGAWLVALLLPAWLNRPEDAGGAAAPQGAPVGDTRRIHATLFYVAADGSELVPAGRDVTYGPTPADQARRIVEAQLDPPPDGLHAPLAAGTRLRAVFLTPRGEVFVDLSREAQAGHPGGSLAEALSVYALVNALTTNLPDVSAVQILVEGREVDTLAGHLDLRHPLGRSLKWVRRGQ